MVIVPSGKVRIMEAQSVSNPLSQGFDRGQIGLDTPVEPTIQEPTSVDEDEVTYDEKKIVENLDMKYFNVPLVVKGKISPRSID